MRSSIFRQDDKMLKAAVIVAHPDDETLWAGGLILKRPRWKWTIAAVCRKDDPDRSPKFSRVLGRLGAQGKIAALDDGPEQSPLADEDVRNAILGLLDERRYDTIITHSPFGEYTRHRRHEETGRAVAALWETGQLTASELWLFAYCDDEAKRAPQAIEHAHLMLDLNENIWRMKYDIIVNMYGFAPDSWEANVTPKREAFWCFRSSQEYRTWLIEEGSQR